MADLTFPAIMVVIVCTHWQLLGDHIANVLKAAYCSLPTLQEDQESRTGARVLDRLMKIRISNLKTMNVVGLHIFLLLGLDFASRFLRQPTVASGLSIMPLLLAYLSDASLLRGKIELTSRMIARRSFFGCSFAFVFSVATYASYTSTTEHLTAMSVNAMGHMLTGLVFLNARLWVPSTITLSVMQLALFAYNFGHGELNTIVFVNTFIQSLICCAVLVGVEMAIRVHLKSQMDAWPHYVPALCTLNCLLRSRISRANVIAQYSARQQLGVKTRLPAGLRTKRTTEQ